MCFLYSFSLYIRPFFFFSSCPAFSYIQCFPYSKNNTFLSIHLFDIFNEVYIQAIFFFCISPSVSLYNAFSFMFCHRLCIVLLYIYDAFQIYIYRIFSLFVFCQDCSVCFSYIYTGNITLSFPRAIQCIFYIYREIRHFVFLLYIQNKDAFSSYIFCQGIFSICVFSLYTYEYFSYIYIETISFSLAFPAHNISVYMENNAYIRHFYITHRCFYYIYQH